MRTDNEEMSMKYPNLKYTQHPRITRPAHLRHRHMPAGACAAVGEIADEHCIAPMADCLLRVFNRHIACRIGGKCAMNLQLALSFIGHHIINMRNLRAKSA